MIGAAIALAIVLFAVGISVTIWLLNQNGWFQGTNHLAS
jgi:hypothetical protein